MDLRTELKSALALADPTERKIAIVAVITSALADLRIRPVIVGGVAVEYWTYGEYATGDIDVVMPYMPVIDERLAQLGFRREGRHWVLPGEDVFFEAPGNALDDREEAVEVEIAPGLSAFVLSAEDILVARLEEFIATGHRDPAEQSVLLLRAQRLDRERLRRRVQEEQLFPVLQAIEELAERRERGEEIELYEFHDLAHRLRAELR